jgi:hypothetical protein
MCQCMLRPDDPILVKSDRIADAYVIQRALDAANVEVGDVDIPFTVTRDIGFFWAKGFWVQSGLVGTCIAFFIAPMWLMVLHKTIWTALISTTAFVFAFAIIVGYLLQGPEVLSIVAAYAAVLVVIVGIST